MDNFQIHNLTSEKASEDFNLTVENHMSLFVYVGDQALATIPV